MLCLLVLGDMFWCPKCVRIVSTRECAWPSGLLGEYPSSVTATFQHVDRNSKILRSSISMVGSSRLRLCEVRRWFLWKARRFQSND